MYTYKLGGMLITDELYHDDLEAMTFGRKDQNELRHSGIKGMSWGKRRFQNEDGSLTAAGRNRYGVGDPMKGVSAYSDTGGRGGSGVSYTRLPSGFGGANRTVSRTGRTYGSTATPSRTPGVSQQTRSNTAKQVSSAKQRVTNRTDAGRKAADNLFGRIGNWASNAAKDVGNVATNAYNGATRAVNDAANWVGDRAQDVKEGIQNLGNTPEARDVGNALNDARNWVDNAAKDVGDFATNAYNDVSKAVGNAAQNISDWYTGDKAGREAQRYDNVVQNFERNGERNINEGKDKISDAIDKDIDRIDIDLHGDKGDSSAHYAKNRDDLHDASNKQFWEGLNQRNMGYRQDDIAREYGQKADEAQTRYDAAPRQLLNAAGNWIGDRVSDAGNAVGNLLKPGINAVGNAVRDAGNWVGDTAKNIYDDADYRLYSLGQDIAEPAKNRAWQDFQNRIAQDREIYNREFPSGDYQTWNSASDRIDDAFKDYQRELYKIEQNPIGSAINNVGRSIGEGAKKAGDWASNAASDVRDWGAGAIDKGRQAFESLFGRSEAPKAELSDPNPTVIPENIIREQIIPEQRITENRIEEQKIPEQRIEEQRIPEAIAREGEKYAQMTPDRRQARMDSQKNRPTVNGSNNVQTWDNANINTWDNVQTFGDPDMVNAIKMLNDNGFFNRGGSSNSGNNSSMPDKPSNVSDEYWRDYTSNGGTRESYDREMNIRRNSQNNQNSSASRQEVVGTVDTSRPYHFTYDPASGQTIVVYDDEKRR